MLTVDTIPQSPAMKRVWIKAMLGFNDLTLRQLARKLNVSPSSVTMALWRPSPKMQAAIAKAIHLRPQQIWPERFDAKGKPLRKRMGRPPVKVGEHQHRVSPAAPSPRNGNRERVA